MDALTKPVTRSDGITLRTFRDESEMQWIVDMMARDLSEPYSVFTYRYFLHNWPDLSWLALDATGAIIGSVVCEIKERKKKKRGYIAMLSVDPAHRRKGIARDLVMQCLRIMRAAGCFMAMLETEVKWGLCGVHALLFIIIVVKVSNKEATLLYTKLGFQKVRMVMIVLLSYLFHDFNGISYTRTNFCVAIISMVEMLGA
jgi:ribosomal protein S18 acetylase RimI-like enzyme